MAYRTPLEARIAKKTTKAILDYQMIEDGDRVMVGLSGGKDSWALIQILDVLRHRAVVACESDGLHRRARAGSGRLSGRRDAVRL